MSRAMNATLVRCSALAFCFAGAQLAESANERTFVTHSRLSFGTQAERSASVRIGDLDGDGDLDVVVANGRHWPEQNFIFFNQGRARFNLARPLGRDLDTSYATELADIDNDGDLDIVVGNDRAPNTVFLNDGTGRFEISCAFGRPASIRSLTLADIDGDGDIDILANARGSQNLIHLNDGMGRFLSSRPFGSADDSTIAVAVGDLDNDGHLDLVLANRDAQQNVVLINDGHAQFSRRIPFGTGRDETRAVAVADLDGDGNLDWAAGNIGQANAVYFGDGKGGVRESMAFGREDGQTYALTIADMDNDTRPDIIVGNVQQPNAVFFNRVAGKDAEVKFQETRFGDASHATYNLAVGDLNQDGYRDIAVANSDAQNVVYLNAPLQKKETASIAATTATTASNQATAVATVTVNESQNWPAFRGAGGKGVADGYPLRAMWNADTAATDAKIEGVLWRAKVPGLGHSSPVVWGDRIFLCTAVSESGESALTLGAGGQPTAADDSGTHHWVVLCYNKFTGEELWRKTAREGAPRATRHVKATQANTSLAVDGKRLVAFFGSEGLYCYDLDGKLLWSRDLGVINISKYGIGWGYASSPAIFENCIVLACDDPSNPFLAALQLSDGKEVWRVSRKDISERSWGTPLIHKGAGKTQVVVNGWPWVVSYDLQTGDAIWRIHGGGDNPIPTPFVANGLIYIASAHGALSPIYAVRPEASGDITPTKEVPSNDGIVWSVMRGGSYMSTPVVYRGLLYLGTSSIVRCFDAATGEKHYEERLPGRASIIASPVAADGKIYCASETGVVYVLAAGKEFNVLAQNPMGEPCLATPAISQGVVYFRTTGSLVAIQ